jgi:hypothetical protein
MVKFMPADFELTQTREPPLKDQYDEWLARIICHAFSVPASPFVSQVSRATPVTPRVQATREVPLKAWVKRALDEIAHVHLGQPDLETARVADDAVDPPRTNGGALSAAAADRAHSLRPLGEFRPARPTRSSPASTARRPRPQGRARPPLPYPTETPMFVFGSGVLIGTPQGGTPINFGLAQEISLNISSTTKALYGQSNFPVAIGSGTRKMTGKCKLARISGQALGNLFFGFAPTPGGTQTQYGETASVPASSPYTYSTAFHSTFVADQGVVYASSALPLKQVATSPTTGQYSVSAGVYTFAAGDAGAPVLISYTYTVTSSGETIAVASTLIGPAITFSANLFASDPTTGKQFSLWLYNCVAEKLALGTKLEDFVVPELDFQCFANAAGQVCQLNFGDAA